MDESKLTPGKLISLVFVYFFVLFVLFRLVFAVGVIKPEGRDAVEGSKATTVREQPLQKEPGGRLSP